MDSIDNNIIDIKFYNNETYLLKKNSITSSKIEKIISKYSYSGEKLIKDELVENSKLPPFITIFYKFIFEKDNIPTEEELFNYYLISYYDTINDKECIIKKSLSDIYCNQTLNINGIKARLLRSYPSFIRDFHFYCLCSESNLFSKVVYSLNTDYFDGYDLLIDYKGNRYAVSLFIETNRGNYYKYRKQNRHKYDQYKEIILKINKSECKNVGRFYLYTPEHVKNLLDSLNNNI